MATVLIEGAPPRARGARTKFYVGISLLITAIVIAGFAPQLYASLVLGVERPWILHVHGAVYMGWLALLIAQTVLAARGRIAMHRRVGSFGVAYAVLVLILGLVVTFVATVLHIQAGEWTMERGGSFLPIPLGDMVLFGGFFGAAVAYRRRPEIHKRLVLLASVALMFAGVGRLWFTDTLPLTLAMWYLPVVLAMAYDLLTLRRIHPAYLIGVAVMTIALLRIPFGQSELWLDIARPMLASLI
jgi:hypothetical protein